jgi:hypothetical protein
LAKAAIDFAIEAKDRVSKAIIEALQGATDKLKPVEKAKKEVDKKFEESGADPFAFFDTRLAQQMVGANPIERQQLEETKLIRKAIEKKQKVGIPVV